MYQRELLAELARLAYETIKELMIEAVAAEKLFAHNIFPWLKGKGLLSEEHMELLLSFRHSWRIEMSNGVLHTSFAFSGSLVLR
jgi:hypothetical protein